MAAVEPLVSREAILARMMVGQGISRVIDDPVHRWMLNRDGESYLVFEGLFDGTSLVFNHLHGALGSAVGLTLSCVRVFRNGQ